MHITIDKEFEALIPPMPAEERTQLEKNLKADGCRDRLVIWNTEGKSILVDGHNRYEICNRLSIPYRTKEMQFKGRREVRVWIRNNQLGRRNVTDAWRIELALGNKADLAEIGLEKMKEMGKEGREKYLSGAGYSKGLSFSEGLSSNDKPLINPTPNPESPTPTPPAPKPEPKPAPIPAPTAAPKPTPAQPTTKPEPVAPAATEKPQAPPPAHNTQKVIAGQVGVSTGKLAQAEVVRNKSPELWKKAKDGEVTIGAAYAEIKKEEKKKQREELLAEQKKAIDEGAVEAPTGLFDVVAIDPPWAYGRRYDPDSSRVANPYPEMQQSELMKIELPVKDDSVLLLWTTHQFLFDAKALMDHWGFTYKATIVWDKEKMGMGAWLRMQCEFCLVGIKGKPYWENTRYRDIIREARREHSRKPDAFFAMVEEITAGRRLEYFSREKRQGWEVFGNDVEKF